MNTWKGDLRKRRKDESVPGEQSQLLTDPDKKLLLVIFCVTKVSLTTSLNSMEYIHSRFLFSHAAHFVEPEATVIVQQLGLGVCKQKLDGKVVNFHPRAVSCTYS